MIIRSTHAHARLRSIATAAALKAPGVIAVLTGEDLAADGLGPLPTDGGRKRRDGSPAFRTPRPALVSGRARRRWRSARAGGGRDGGAGRRRRGAGHGRLRAAARRRRRGGRHRGRSARGLGRGARQRGLRLGGRLAGNGRARLRGRRARHAPRLRGHPRGRAADGAARGGGRVRPPHRALHAPHRDPGAPRPPHPARRAGPPGAAHPGAGGDRRRGRQLRDAQRHLPRAGAGALGRQAARPAGEVDVEPARELPLRRARARQRLLGRAGAGRGRQVPGPAGRHQARHRRLPHDAERGARHQQRGRRGRRLHHARHPRRDHRRLHQHHPDRPLPRRRPARGDLRDRAGDRHRGGASSGSTRSSCAAAT